MTDTSKRQDGGPAFPHDNFERSREEGGWTGVSTGMTLRDWFAGQALAGTLSASPNSDAHPMDIVRGLARMSYAIADAMIAERAK